MTSQKFSHCPACSGLIPEPNQNYMYSGKICYCRMSGAAWQAERDKAELERYKNDADRSLQLMALTMESQSAQLERMRAVVEAAKEMRALLHLRLRYCPEALWLEENYIKLKDALAAIERGGDK